ncbi:GNAT family N-acetyltransferase [Psychroserpens sp. BH13MA-6]
MYQVTLLDKTSKDQVDQCLDLLLTSFKGDLDYFKWKHDLEGQYHLEEYTFCIFHDQLCIATTQVIVHQMFVSGHTHRFGLLCDGATHKDYRRLGLFEKLLSHINQFSQQHNIDFVYSTGNKKSRKALFKLGFEDFFTTLKASKRIRYNHPLLKLYNLTKLAIVGLSLPKTHAVKPITLDDYAKYYAQHKGDIEISFDKNSNYLKWRLDETTGTYHVYGVFNDADIVNGVVVLKITDNRLYIMDLLASNSKDIDSLLTYVDAVAINHKAIHKINASHNNFAAYKNELISHKYDMSHQDNSALIYITNPDFKLSNLYLENMHYMRIDKNE